MYDVTEHCNHNRFNYPYPQLTMTQYHSPDRGYLETMEYLNMARYLPYKTKKFKLKKDAIKWTKDTKASYKGAMQMKIETNYNANDPFPWEGIVLMKEQNG